MPKNTNVGTIGHIDHGKATLAPELISRNINIQGTLTGRITGKKANIVVADDIQLKDIQRQRRNRQIMRSGVEPKFRGHAFDVPVG